MSLEIAVSNCQVLCPSKMENFQRQPLACTTMESDNHICMPVQLISTLGHSAILNVSADGTISAEFDGNRFHERLSF